MLIVKNSKIEHKIRPTIFPDGTSQVWKLPEELHDSDVKITWFYENDSELVQLNQLVDLIKTDFLCRIKEIFIPYFPYGRQDKEISNELTFAKYTFVNMLPGSVNCVYNYTTLDIHSNFYTGMFPKMIKSLSPKQYIQQAIDASKSTTSTLYLVFPDQGAANRYSHMFPEYDYLVVEKVRDQLTGEITGLQFSKDDLASMECVSSIIFYGARTTFLIIDDICDGGMTFIKTAELLKDSFQHITSINLYVTHGIFSKGLSVLHNAGIEVIFTTESLSYFRENKGLGSFGFELNTED